MFSFVVLIYLFDFNREKVSYVYVYEDYCLTKLRTNASLFFLYSNDVLPYKITIEGKTGSNMLSSLRMPKELANVHLLP